MSTGVVRRATFSSELYVPYHLLGQITGVLLQGIVFRDKNGYGFKNRII